MFVDAFFYAVTFLTIDVLGRAVCAATLSVRSVLLFPVVPADAA